MKATAILKEIDENGVEWLRTYRRNDDKQWVKEGRVKLRDPNYRPNPADLKHAVVPGWLDNACALASLALILLVLVCIIIFVFDYV